MRMNNTERISKESMKRDPYWDTLKFILIFCVVLVHCLGGYKPDGGMNQAIYNLLLTIVMPSFIFMSGMFSQIKDRKKYKKGILRIFETYAVFQLIRAVPPMLVSGNITFMSIASVIGGPRYTLWYLLSLVFWRLMVYFMPEKLLRDNPIRIIVGCFLISLLGGFVPIDSQFSLQRTITYLPFFFMGHYAMNIDVKKYVAKIPPLLAVGVLLSVFMIIFFLFNTNLNIVLMGKSSYWHNANFPPLSLCLGRFIFLSSAIITGSMVMRLVMIKPVFPEWGKITLFIYIYHSFLIQAVRFVIRHSHIPQNEWIYYVIAVFITGILICLSKVKFFNILLNPISYISGKHAAK